LLAVVEARALLDSFYTSTHAGLRDRALIGLMVYSFVRIGAAFGMALPLGVDWSAYDREVSSK
jgi:integrase/recombinase XerC